MYTIDSKSNVTCQFSGRSASRRPWRNHDSQYATAGYPQYSQIESKQVIFAGAPIKRVCLRIFTRRWVNNGVSTRSRYTSSRPAGWWHFRIGFLIFSIRSLRFIPAR